MHKDDESFLIDKYRAPLGYLFEINDFIRNFHYHKSDTVTKSLLDLCLHVESLKDSFENEDDVKISSYLPEFNCLYISPANFWSNSKIKFKTDENIFNKLNNNKFRDILFGIRWSDLLQTYKFNETTLVTFAITIAFKNYDKEFINELKSKLYEKFQQKNMIEKTLNNNFIHLQYTSKSFWYYLVFISLFILLFLYIYISVSKIEFVSK